MESHKKKMIAPIVVASLLVLYYAVYFGFLLTLLEGAWKYILAVMPLAMAVVTVKMCRERIEEIKGGEEDDLSQY